MTSYYDKASVNVKVEPWAVCEQYDFNTGNVIKYILRANYKGDKESDLKKAQAYIARIVKSKYEDETTVAYANVPEPIIKAFCESNEYFAILFANSWDGEITMDNLLALDRKIEQDLNE